MNAIALTPGAGKLARIAVLALAIAAGAAPASALAGHGQTTCQGQDVPISKYTLGDAELASMCLLNLYRQTAGIEPVSLSRELANAAEAHSRDMVERDYLGSTSPDGEEPPDRASKAGYYGGVGESTAASPDPDATPHDLFGGLLDDERHRQLILADQYEAVGIGFALGAPEMVSDDGVGLGPEGVTMTQLFGTTAPSSTYTALELAGRDPGKTAECGRAKDARSKARRAWKQAKADRRAVQSKLRKAGSEHRRGQLAEKLKQKRKLVAKRRSALRRATAKQDAVC